MTANSMSSVMSKLQFDTSRYLMASIRMITGSWFLATAAGILLVPERRTILDGLVPSHLAAPTTGFCLFALALLMMTGVFARVSTFLLAGFAFWSMWIHLPATFGAPAPAALWLDLVILAAVLMIAITDRAGIREMDPETFGKRIAAARDRQMALPQTRQANTNMFADAFDMPRGKIRPQRLRS